MEHLKYSGKSKEFIPIFDQIAVLNKATDK